MPTGVAVVLRVSREYPADPRYLMYRALTSTPAPAAIWLSFGDGPPLNADPRVQAFCQRWVEAGCLQALGPDAIKPPNTVGLVGVAVLSQYLESHERNGEVTITGDLSGVFARFADNVTAAMQWCREQSLAQLFSELPTPIPAGEQKPD